MLTFNSRRIALGLVMTLALIALVLPTFAQDDMMMSPSVEVSDQNVLNGMVKVDFIYSPGPGFIVIHADNGEGSFGAVIGERLLSPGANYEVWVPILAEEATSTLYAMLHEDTGIAGQYEFGMTEGADGPVIVDGAPVTPAFNVAVINAHDQFVDGSFTAASITMDSAGWLVVHAGDAESFGAVLGATQVEAGTTTNVSVALEGDVTDVLWPMLHVDTGTEGEYEFGAVEGADGPVVINDAVATTPIWTIPHVRVNDQVVLHGDGMDMMDMGTILRADSVLSEGAGWLVVHADADGAPGPVAGLAPVEAGTNAPVLVELDPEVATPVLWPMLHVDDGVMGEYEFGAVEGADGPVFVNDAVLTFPVNAAPSIVYNAHVSDMGDMGSAVVIDSAVIDAPGWMVIHADDGGAPGAVLGVRALTPGLNTHIVVPIEDMDAVGSSVFPMLHYDTGEAGVYEFGAVEGADAPVFVGGNVVTGPAEVMSGM